ncbi:hypothetical protein AVL61_00195 [Kocuria rosea subsp. polaris]|uniref:Uncharacterized protein n=1 Tax=Kocuria rosea subsp. polaris TaxID=136273 RepID=A0A0W8IN63_KOCRO|nr:hypothetical protein [Kocuria polaris]KUG61390.1 hypothetical protein AVL61_00195 [Kocuria polaris]
MATPFVPELPQLPEFSGGSPAPPASPRPARAFEPAATGVLLLLLALTLVLAVLVRAVPVGPLITVALLLLVSAGVLAVGAREDDGSVPVPGDLLEVPETAGAYYYDRQGRPVPIEDAF